MFNNIKRSVNSLSSTTATVLDLSADAMTILADKASKYIEGYQLSNTLDKKAYLRERKSEAIENYVDSCKRVQDTYMRVQTKIQQLSPQFREDCEKLIKEFK